jgi:DNA-binding beta-propeller fold protein YncE
MSADKTICRVTNTEEQQTETYRYWHSLSVGERLSAVWEVSQAAYAFAAAFKENLTNDAQGSERTITRVQRSRG